MIEELTPQVLMAFMALIIVTAPLLTFLLCALLLWRYRRAVTRAMTAAAGFPNPPEEGALAESPYSGNSKIVHGALETSSNELYQRATRAPWRDAVLYAVAVLVAALLFAVAAQQLFADNPAVPLFHYVYNLGMPGFLIGAWIYVWPVVLALPLIVPSSIQLWVLSIVGYFVGYSLLGLWGSTIANISGMERGNVLLPPISSVQPFTMTTFWLSMNALPTILTILCFNRRVRAVAPLVLTLVTIVISEVWFSLIFFPGFFLGPAGRSALAWLERLANYAHPVWIVLVLFTLPLASFVLMGWALARWIARAYTRRMLSDRSLILDGLWLVFFCTYTMWLVVGGLEWVAIAPVGFLAYKLVLAAGSRIPNRQLNTSRGLTFLRVFSLGRRSEALLEVLAKYWRHIGSVQMITGPDLARTTIQPHQFLDFLSGKLSKHFVGDAASLERSLAERDFKQDPDGRFRINSLFCHKDSWQPALPRLVQEGDTVLMDLRNFSASNAGCIHELNFLASEVPYDRCVFVVDDTTDKNFLKETLKETCQQLLPSSPNYGCASDEIPMHQLKSGITSVQRLVKRLCNAQCQDSASFTT